MTSPTTLYRLFDSEGALLYVGVAGNPGRRWEQHAGEKPWWGLVARTTLQHFEHRQDALVAELEAIRNEDPIYNIVGRGVRRIIKENTVSESPRMDRLSAAADREFASDSLVGSFFHSADPPGWQGCVVAEPHPGVYLVELFSWMMGESSNQELVTLAEMTDWQFYDTAEWMNNVYEHGLKQRWEHARAERRQRVEKASGEDPTS